MPINWVLLSGFLLRFYSAAVRGVINRDGHHYIYQAQAIFSGHWSDIVSCELKYVSIYPFLVAAANTLFRDWIVSGVCVNVIMGFATLLPLYYLLRRFFDETVCVVTVFVYALMPTFVNSSGDIVRGPVFWFFLSMGMLMFVRQWDESGGKQHFRSDLVMSCLFYMLAAGARIEATAFIAASLFYLLVAGTDRKLERILIFLSPLACLVLAVLAAALFSGHDVAARLRVEKITTEISQFIFQYRQLDGQLKTLSMQQEGILYEFLHRVREAIWIVPFGIILHNIIESFFYPFALIYFIGFGHIRRKLRECRHGAYLLWLVFTAFCVLYIHLIQMGIMIHRFFAILMLPSCLVIAHGVEISLAFIQRRFQHKHITAAMVLVIFFCLTGLPKDLIPKEADGRLYRQAARLIAENKSFDQIERIACAQRSSTYEYLLLYAHRSYPDPLCGMELLVTIPADAGYDQMVSLLDNRHVRYLLYEKRYWSDRPMDLLSTAGRRDFRLLGKWRKSNNEEFMLFERIR